MGYIGNQTSNSYTSLDKQVITGDGGASYTLDHAVANENELEVFVNNVRQEPSVAYTVSGTSLTMTGNVAASDDFYVVFQGKAIQTTSHPEGQDLQARDGTFSGDVGIGTTTPNTVLEIASGDAGNDAALNSPTLRITNTTQSADWDIGDVIGTTEFYLEDASGNAPYVASYIKCVNEDGGSLASGALAFGTADYNAANGATESMRILSSGGITFNGDTASANALDDYEEGTWTPTTSSGSWTVNSANYTKIGNLVVCTFWVTATSTVGAVDFTGLPFTPQSEAGGVVGFQDLRDGVMSILIQGAGVWNFRQGSTQYGLGNGDTARGTLTYHTTA